MTAPRPPLDRSPLPAVLGLGDGELVTDPYTPGAAAGIGQTALLVGYQIAARSAEAHRAARQRLWGPETRPTAADLLLHRWRQPGMIPP